MKEIVWNVISDQMEYFCDFQKAIDFLKTGEKETCNQIDCKEENRSVLLKMKSKQAKREKLYEDFTDGILTPEE